MTEKLSVFILGGTGYVGGSALVDLEKRHPEARFVTLLRNPADNAAFEPLGVEVSSTGAHSDLALIEKLASEHDVVFNIADSDTLPLTQAILAGLEKRARDQQNAPHKPLLIHTSGTGLITKELDGGFHNDKVYNDSNVEDIKGIPDNAFHRNVDLEILPADKRGLIDAYIVAPCTVYGKSRGPLPRLSIQINGLIELALRRKELVQVGLSTNVWNLVHIDDLSTFCALLFDYALSGKDKSTDSFERVYWVSGEEYVWGDVAKELAKLLYAAGAIETPAPKPLTVQEEPGLLVAASNSRAISTRGPKNLGWKIQGPSLWDNLLHEVEWTIADFKAKA